MPRRSAFSTPRSIRFPAELDTLINAEIEARNADPVLAATGGANRADVVREALVEGLAVLRRRRAARQPALPGIGDG